MLGMDTTPFRSRWRRQQLPSPQSRGDPRLRCPTTDDLVSVSSPANDGVTYGLIYDVAIEDDLFVRQLVTADLRHS